MITLSDTDYQKIKNALQFYADGEHTHMIMNRRGVNFTVEREKMESASFSFEYETYNGDEVYVENGTKAQSALDLMIELENERS